MVDHHHSMFFVVFGAAVIPFVARRIRVPSAALEILYGAWLFNTLFNHSPEWFLLLKEIGFIYLMFIAGMELDLPRIRQSGKSFWYALVSVLSFVLTPLLFLFMGAPFFFGTGGRNDFGRNRYPRTERI